MTLSFATLLIIIFGQVIIGTFATASTSMTPITMTEMPNTATTMLKITTAVLPNTTTTSMINTTTTTMLNITTKMLPNATTTAMPNTTTSAFQNITTTTTPNTTILAAANLATVATSNSSLLSTIMADKKCGQPPAISAASSVVVGNIATYTCNSGYNLNGSTQTYCVNGTWTGELPICKPSNFQFQNKPQIFNQVQSIPLWLMIILGAVGVCGALLLLCCMLAICVKFLCCKSSSKRISDDMSATALERSKFTKKSNVIHDERETNYVSHDERKKSVVSHDERKKSNVSLSKVTFAEEIKGKQDKFQVLTNNGVGIKTQTTPAPPTYAAIVKERKRAKVVKKWMPHQHEIRDFNTSTK